MRRSRSSSGLLCLVVSCAALSTTPERAKACGGFFCDNTQPVNQQAERIIFTRDDDGTVSAVVQIQYSGPAERFAWVLPVAGSPEVDVSSNIAFVRLQNATNPQYQLTTRVEGTCRGDGRFGPRASGPGGDAGALGFEDSGPPPVTVVDSGSVGPYDYVVISVDRALSPLSTVAVSWLRDNGYDIDESGAALLEPYLVGGMNLLAFRLTKGNDTGSIRPVVIRFGTGMASIPIRPTAVAAVENMGVLVWVLGPHRAIPANYLSLELNDALINWLNPGPTYDAVVTAAANEAGGQGFVTEMAGPAARLAAAIHLEWEREAWSAIQGASWAEREGELLSRVTGIFRGWDGLRDVFAAHVPLPAGVELDELLSCVSCYYGSEVADIDGFDPAAFLAAVDTQVVRPVERTAALFERAPYVTRLYTTMSAAEMTRDPAFDFNADLGEVSNVHIAERVIECSPSISQFEAPWRVTLPSGETVRGRGNTWPFTPGEGMPANSRVRRVGTEGEGDVIEDNVGVISAALRAHNDTVPGAPSSTGACACRAVGAGASAHGALLVLVALAVAIAARRRRG